RSPRSRSTCRRPWNDSSCLWTTGARPRCGPRGSSRSRFRTGVTCTCSSAAINRSTMRTTPLFARSLRAAPSARRVPDRGERHPALVRRWRDDLLVVAAALLSLGALVVVAAALLPLALFIVRERQIAGAAGFPLDDSWIHLQFARNLAAGAGFSYNPGRPIAGSTAPLWTLLLGAGALVASASLA